MEENFEQRLAATTDQDTVRGMMFNGVFATMQESLGAAAAQALREKMGNAKFVDFFSYPLAQYIRLAWAAVDLLAPSMPSRESAFFHLGHAAASTFLASPVGKTLQTLVARDPRRMLSNVSGAYGAAVSYGERTLTWKGERHAHLAFRRDFLVPIYQEGVLTAAVEQVGGKNVRVKSHVLALLDVDYDVTWE
jgi:uncharacterized protein (TIGR02265 family)